jgi:tryptophanyl-tRNA synthetase
MIEEHQGLSLGDRERLLGYLEGGGKMILVEPEAKLTPASRMPGLDGQKMSKSYNNTISLREDPDVISKKIRTMPTDPARVRRTDPGEPEKCPVFDLHKIYSDEKTREWAAIGCRTAGIGCLECKKPLIDKVVEEISGIRKRAVEFEENPELVRNLAAEGAEKARDAARATLDDVRRAMNLRVD